MTEDAAQKHRVPLIISLVLGVAFALTQWVLMAAVRTSDLFSGQVLPADVVVPVMSLAFVIVGAVVVARGGPVRYGWLMIAFGLTRAITQIAGMYAVLAFENGWPALAPAVWVQDIYTVGFLLGLLLLPSLFPDGRPASAGWARVVRLAGWGWVLWTVVWAFLEREATNWFDNADLDEIPMNAAGFIPAPEAVFGFVLLSWLVLTFGSAVISIGSLRRRWKDANFETKQQIKWVALGFSALVVGQLVDTAVSLVSDATGLGPELRWFVNLGGAVLVVLFVVSLGLALLRYRLYDVDLFINRTVVYGLLTVALLGLFMGAILALGALLPDRQTMPAFIGAALVAALFGPLRTWLQDRINRLMFGSRNDPLAVVSQAGRLVAETGTPEAALQSLTEAVAESLKLPGAAIEIERGHRWETLAHAGTTTLDDSWQHFPLRHQGEVVGRLVVAPRSPREPLNAKDMRLLETVADSSGAAVRAVRLSNVLQSAREQLVLAREEERRRIRRDLHDGLGPSLASQTFQLDAVLDALHNDPAGAADLVMDLKERNQELVADIRRLVYELRPPALDELGVVGAIVTYVAQLDSSSVAIDVASRPDPLPDLPAAVEVAAYRIVREAIANVVRHADARHCQVRFKLADGQLLLTVEDDGTGIASTSPSGVGLRSMRERSDELGGTLSIVGDASGTVVRASLPVGAASSHQAVDTEQVSADA